MNNVYVNKIKKKITKLIFIFGIFLIVLSSCYSYAIAKTTTSIASLRQKKIEIQQLETEIIDLETEYFEIVNSVDRDNFTAYGLEKKIDLEYVNIDISKLNSQL